MSVRMANLQDVPRILEIYGPYVENTAISFEYAVPTLEEFTQRFLSITAQFPWLVWEEDGQVLGYAYGSRPFERAAYQWNASASIYLCPEAWGKGIGKQLYAALEQLLQRQGYRKLYAVITTANDASVAFHKAVGYRHTATMPDCGYKFGKWYGTVWMEKDLNTWDTPPHKPVPNGIQFLTLREKPELMDSAAEWFSSKWRAPKEAYLACMDAYLEEKTAYGWYLCVKGNEIVGGLGVIENDFHNRKDLTPNICAVFTEEKYRKRGIAGRLLTMAVEDLRDQGISPVYLVTDHMGFYERYGWEFFCMVQCDGETTPSRMYIHR